MDILNLFSIHYGKVFGGINTDGDPCMLNGYFKDVLGNICTDMFSKTKKRKNHNFDWVM